MNKKDAFDSSAQGFDMNFFPYMYSHPAPATAATVLSSVMSSLVFGIGASVALDSNLAFIVGTLVLPAMFLLTMIVGVRTHYLYGLKTGTGTDIMKKYIRLPEELRKEFAGSDKQFRSNVVVATGEQLREISSAMDAVYYSYRDKEAAIQRSTPKPESVAIRSMIDKLERVGEGMKEEADTYKELM